MSTSTIKDVHHDYNIGDTVEICEDDIDSSNDVEVLESLLKEKLTVSHVELSKCGQIYYTLKNSKDNVIFFSENVPFGFTDVDLITLG